MNKYHCQKCINEPKCTKIDRFLTFDSRYCNEYKPKKPYKKIIKSIVNENERI